MTLIHPVDRHDLIAPHDLPLHLVEDHGVDLSAPITDAGFQAAVAFLTIRGIEFDVVDVDVLGVHLSGRLIVFAQALHERDHEVQEAEPEVIP